MEPLITPFSVKPITITMNQILDSYNSQFLDKILMASVFYLIMTLFIWWHMNKITETIKDPIQKRIFEGYVYLNIVVALYFPIQMIGYRTGWFI